MSPKLPDSVEFEDGTAIDLTKQDFEFFKLIKPMCGGKQRESSEQEMI